MSASPWLVSARFDGAVFVLPAMLSLLVAALSGRLTDAGETPTWAWLLFVVGVDVAHTYGTTLRVYLDPVELRRRRGLYLAVPLLAFAVSVLLYAIAARWFWCGLAYLAVFHFMRQQVGWARLYRLRAQESSRFDARLDDAALYAAMLYPLIVWHTRLPAEFEWFVPGDFFNGLPTRVADLAMLPWALTLAGFALRQLQLRAAGVPWRYGKIALVVCTASTWWLGIVVWAQDFAFTVTNVLIHGVPYMVMSHRVGTRSHALGLGVYVAVLVGLAGLEEWLWDAAVWHEHGGLVLDAALGVIVPLLALPQITHYVLDAYLWRLDGSNPGLREVLINARVRAPTRRAAP